MARSLSAIGQRRKQARTDPGPGYQDRRAALLKAAATVFKQHGFEAVSMNDIARAVGTDRATVYYYYGSKQELFLDLIRPAVAEVVQLAEAVAAGDEPPTTKLRRLIRTQLEAYERHYPYLYLYVQEEPQRIAAGSSRVGRELSRLGQRYDAALNAITTEGIAGGALRADLDARLIQLAIVGAVNWSHRWFKPGGPSSGTAVGETYAEILLFGVSAQARPAPARPRTRRKSAPA